MAQVFFISEIPFKESVGAIIMNQLSIRKGRLVVCRSHEGDDSDFDTPDSSCGRLGDCTDEMMRWGDGELGRRGAGEMGRWGDGEMEKWRDGEMGRWEEGRWGEGV